MKNKINLLLLTIISAISAHNVNAQEFYLASANTRTEVRADYLLNENKLERAIEAYQRGLNHSMPAIVESSMFNLLVLKIDYPSTEFTTVLKKLNELSLYGKTSAIRYKAHVTTAFINDPTLFLEVEVTDFMKYLDVEKADHFYLALSNVLQNQITPLNH
jgi:hypothetical protein